MSKKDKDSKTKVKKQAKPLPPVIEEEIAATGKEEPIAQEPKSVNTSKAASEEQQGQSNSGLYWILLILLLLVASIAFMFLQQNGKAASPNIAPSGEAEGYQPGPEPPALLDQEHDSVNKSSTNSDDSKNSLQQAALTATQERHNAESAKALEDAKHQNSTQKLQYKAYLEYLENANRLVSMFWLDQDYRHELRYIQRYPMPRSLEVLMIRLERYSAYLDEDNNVKQLFFPSHNSFLARFIRIYKISDDVYIKEALRQDIYMQMEELQEYFYSDEMKKQFKIGK